MLKRKFVIGLDFDNTLVSYDEVMQQTAVVLGFISRNTAVQDKVEIRDYIRGLPEGEIKWQKLQAEVYGKRMNQARLIEGVEKFIKACKNNDIKIFIVSHKTKYAAQDQEGVNLQIAALNWMKQNNFFSNSGLGLTEDRIYFEESRYAKVFRIKALECTHFVDDLQEIFQEEGFPKETVPMLFSPASTHASSGTNIFRSWDDIYNYFFVQTVSIKGL